MRRVFAIFMFVLLLCGCKGAEQGMDKAMSLRSDLLNAAGCTFDAEITADFVDKTYTFTLACTSDEDGNLTFCVLEPEYIAGISGRIGYGGGELTFHDVALGFGLQNNGVLSPVSGPWVLLKALREGNIRCCTTENDLFRMTLNDSYRNDALMLDVWIDAQGVPIQADIYEENRRIMSIVVENYKLM